MRVVHQSPIDYYLRLNDHEQHMNPSIGHTIQLSFEGLIHCVQCGRKTSKSYQQGFCYPCMMRLQECNLCTIRPECCLVEEGHCPKDDWAHAHCHQTHIIYLANSSGLKVGITRHNQVPTRWIDQGAIQALPIFEVDNRYRAGQVEVSLKPYVSDRTNWRRMLKGEAPPLDLIAEKKQLLDQAATALEPWTKKWGPDGLRPVDAHTLTFDYPDDYTLSTVRSLSFDKTPEIQGTLLGIKGQYLILDTGVLNIRKFGGYQIAIKTLN
jgi:hypothetical protein